MGERRLWRAKGEKVNFIQKLFGDKKNSFEDLISTIEQYSEPAIQIIKTEKPRFSKIGGNPNLGEDFSWPYHKGIPLAFIAK